MKTLNPINFLSFFRSCMIAPPRNACDRIEQRETRSLGARYTLGKALLWFPELEVILVKDVWVC